MEMPGPLSDGAEHHQQCEVQKMLKALLKQCLKGGEQHEAELLLQDCFHAVKKALLSDSAAHNELLEDLEALRASPDGAEYRHFVNICNRLLEILRKISVRGLRDPSSLDMKFFCNIPKWTTSDDAQLSPDIVIVSAKHNPSASIISIDSDLSISDKDDDSDTWPQDDSTKPPYVRLTWDKVLSAVEGEIGEKSNFSPPSPDYTDVIKKIPPQDFREAQKESTHESTKTAQMDSQNSTCSDDGITSTASASMAWEPPMFRIARYAMARHSSSPAITHTVNMTFNGPVIHLWYYDSEGSIQTYGLDMIHNLPYFGILLLAFQRFTEAEWGVMTEFRDALSDFSKVLTFPSTEFNPWPIEITVDRSTRFRTSHALHGRRTCVYGARRKSDGDGPNDLVLKAYFPERAKVSEVEIIREASKLENKEPDIRGHLPTIICHMDFNDFATDRIRHDLNLSAEDGVKSARLPRLIVFIKYEKFVMAFKRGTNVLEAEFWKLFRCHYRLWLHGVEHGDISLGNLLWDPVENVGKLNDFDLARLRGRSTDIGHARMGTMAFMAIDLLSNDGLSGRFAKMYRHEAESFIWVLVWILARYNGIEEVHSHFDSFQAQSYERCYKEKVACLQIVCSIKSYNPELWQSSCNVLLELIIRHQTMQFRRQLPSSWKEEPEEAVKWYKTLFPQMADALADLKLTL